MKLSLNNRTSVFILWIVFLLYLVCYCLTDWKSEHYSFFLAQLSLPFIYIYPCFSFLFHLTKKQKLNLTLSATFSICILASLNYILARFFLLNTTLQWLAWFLFLTPEIINKFSLLTSILKSIFSFFARTVESYFLSHLLLILTLLLILYSWINPLDSAILPPKGFDLSMVHLSLVKTYLHYDGIITPWWIRGTFIPQLIHLFYAGGIKWLYAFAIRGDLFPAFTSTLAFVFLSLCLFDLFKNRTLTLFCTLLIISIPVIKWDLSNAYLDSILILLIFSCFVFGKTYIEEKSNKYLYLLFLASGFAFSAKNFAAILFTPIFIYIVVLELVSNHKLSVKKYILGFLLFFIPVGIFYHYNHIINGSFLFPYVFKYPNGIYWDEITLKTFQSAVGYFAKFRTMLSWILLPWTMSTSTDYSDTPGFDLGYGFLILWFSLVIIFLYNKSYTKIKSLDFFFVFILLLQMMLWYKSSPVYRYFSSVIPIFIYACVYQFYNLKKYRHYLLCSLTVLPILGITQNFIQKTPPPPLSRAEVTDYLSKNIRSYGAVLQFNQQEQIKKDIIIYTIHDEGSFLYYNFPFMGDWFTEHNYSVLYEKTPSQIKQFFSSRRISHILYNEYSAALIKNFPDSLREYKKCFEVVVSAPQFPQIKIYKLLRNDLFCYDQSIPEHPSIKSLQKLYPVESQIPLWRE